MKLTLMLMGGSALLIIGILAIYYFSGATTMNVVEIANMANIPEHVQKVFFPFVFIGFGVLGALFPFHTHGAPTVTLQRLPRFPCSTLVC